MRLHCSPSILPWSFGLLLFLVVPAGVAQMDRTIEVMPIAGAPFMAVINVEHIQIKEDGSEINLKIKEMIARDSQGRVFRDVRPIHSAADVPNPSIVFAEIYDPKSKAYIFMNAQRHVYWMGKLAQPPAGLADGFFYDSPVDQNHPVGNFQATTWAHRPWMGFQSAASVKWRRPRLLRVRAPLRQENIGIRTICI